MSAAKQYSPTDYVLTGLGFLFLAMPVFWFAILLKQLAVNINLQTGHAFFYTIGDRSIETTGGLGAQIGDIAGHRKVRFGRQRNAQWFIVIARAIRLRGFMRCQRHDTGRA